MKIYKELETTVALVPLENLAQALAESIESGKYTKIPFDICDMSEEELDQAEPIGSWYGCQTKSEFDADIISIGYYGGGFYEAFEWNKYADTVQDLKICLKSIFTSAMESFDGKFVCVDITNLPKETVAILSGEEKTTLNETSDRLCER